MTTYDNIAVCVRVRLLVDMSKSYLYGVISPCRSILHSTDLPLRYVIPFLKSDNSSINLMIILKPLHTGYIHISLYTDGRDYDLLYLPLIRVAPNSEFDRIPNTEYIRSWRISEYRIPNSIRSWKRSEYRIPNNIRSWNSTNTEYRIVFVHEKCPNTE